MERQENESGSFSFHGDPVDVDIHPLDETLEIKSPRSHPEAGTHDKRGHNNYPKGIIP